jgi:hypothetical protein
MEDFHSLMVQILRKPHGVYSFFNGLAPDNLFFHGVACQCIKLQLSQLGCDAEFISCEIIPPDGDRRSGCDRESGDGSTWKGIRRKYWHDRDVYYLPRITWNSEYMETGTILEDPILTEIRNHKHRLDDAAENAGEPVPVHESSKRQRASS